MARGARGYGGEGGYPGAKKKTRMPARFLVNELRVLRSFAPLITPVGWGDGDIYCLAFLAYLSANGEKPSSSRRKAKSALFL